MTASELADSAKSDAAPPAELGTALHAMWLARAGRWHEAHDLCPEIRGRDGAWIHAWLHREEGDIGDAGYWYRQAGRSAPSPGTTLEREWMDIASELCLRP